uniref:Wall-associated receptor kinase galacturonan-binding domain-containing protein n=1 Tax=Oryza punctata TaxID=4537 RepID=A0A0E0L5E2_ORYPU
MPPLLFHLLIVLVLSVVVGGGGMYDAAICKRPMFCGEQVEIKYPFYLSNTTDQVVVDGTINTTGRYCGYPWLGIICDHDGGSNRAILRLGNYNYTVLEINHGSHTVTVVDSDVLDGDCPRVKHNVTLPPVLTFPSPGNDSITFLLDCNPTADAVLRPPPYIRPINCSSFDSDGRRDTASFVAAQPDVADETEWFGLCKEVVVAPVLKDWLLSKELYDKLGDDGYGEVLKRGFQMSWDPTAGMCHGCEVSGGRCSYDGKTTFLGCLCSDGHVSKTVCEAASILFLSPFLVALHHHTFEKMHPLYALPLLIIILLSSVPPSVQESGAYFRYTNCAPASYQCGSLKFDVDYPFSANGVDRPDYCSYPGYRLFCTTEKMLVIYMNSIAFQVTDIDYGNKILSPIYRLYLLSMILSRAFPGEAPTIDWTTH